MTSAPEPKMFDNPLAYPRPEPAPKFTPQAAAGICLVSLALIITAHLIPRTQESIITSPSHLREIEIFAGPTQTEFYLHNAGYRLSHKRQLIAVVAGAGAYTVTWPGPDAIRIAFAHSWSRILRGHPQGITVAITAPREE